MSKEQQTKITLQELMRRKEQMLEAKKKKKTAEFYVASLDGTITIEEPSAAICRDCAELEESNDADEYLLLNVIVDPPLQKKEIQDAFECKMPLDIIEKIFAPGEIRALAAAALELAGFGSDSVRKVSPTENIKN